MITRGQITSVFGEPDATGGTSRKYPTPSVYLYGKMEFHFGPRYTDGLVFIQYKDIETDTKILLYKANK